MELKTIKMKYITHIPKKKDFAIWMAICLIILISLTSKFVLSPENWFLILPMSLLAFFMFNLLIRKSLSFKRYFTSPFNVLTSKNRSQVSLPITRELMFDKIIEVIKDSSFNLITARKDTYEILATTRITWLSWGENLYIELEGNGYDESIMHFCSVTFFQVHAWGKNEKNYTDLMNAIEESFTV